MRQPPLSKPLVDLLPLQRVRRVHYAFTVLYGLALTVLMITSVVGVDYASTAMNGLLAFNVGVAFLLFGTTIVGRRMQKQYDEFHLYQDAVVLLSVTCILSLLFTLYPVTRLIQLLGWECQAATPSTSPVCTTEYGFAVFWLIFMLLLCVLNVVTAVCYVVLKHRD
jgi:hypothetical protein